MKDQNKESKKEVEIYFRTIKNKLSILEEAGLVPATKDEYLQLRTKPKVEEEVLQT